jgi:proline dehydrogenase
MVKKIFNDTKRAFSLKSDEDLKRSMFIFEMLDKPFMVKIGTRLTNWALKIGLPVENLIKKTIFRQFCGGVSEEDCLPVIEKMYAKKVHSILDYSSEGKETEAELDSVLEKKIKILEFSSKRKEIPFAMFKPTGIGRFEIWEKVSANETLTLEESEEWQRVKKRVDTLCKTAYDLKVCLLADAEESWIQAAVDDLLEEMMKKYNQEEVIVHNTFQCYRWDRLEYIKSLCQRAKEGGFKVGAKIVRGAYMEKENARAEKMGYPTPICEDKEATDVNFNAVLAFCLQNLDDISLFIGTHNEVSSYLAMQLMEEMGFEKNDSRIWFSQLYGMSDHISFNLGANGYKTAKWVPFGKIEEVIPYLIRRAQENTSVKGQTGRELALLQEEKQRREGSYVKRV